MGRYRPSSAYGFRIERLSYGDYRLHWPSDRYYERSRLRHPTGGTRDTDEAGALRFAKKHGVEMPADPKTRERENAD